MKKKNEEKKGVLSLILGILILGIIFFISRYNDDRLDSKRKGEDLIYTKLDKCYYEYKGVITDISQSNGYTGKRLFQLSNGQKFSLSETTRNYKYCNCDFSYFLQRGDSIFKPANTDSIYLYRDGDVYYFLLGQILNENIKGRSK